MMAKSKKMPKGFKEIMNEARTGKSSDKSTDEQRTPKKAKKKKK